MSAVNFSTFYKRSVVSRFYTDFRGVIVVLLVAYSVQCLYVILFTIFSETVKSPLHGSIPSPINLLFLLHFLSSFTFNFDLTSRFMFSLYSSNRIIFSCLLLFWNVDPRDYLVLTTRLFFLFFSVPHFLLKREISSYPFNCHPYV